MSWLKACELGDPETALWHLDRKLASEVDEEARKKNGEHGYVVAVKLSMGDPRIEQDAVDLIRRVDGLIEEGKVAPDFWSEAAHEVRYFGDLPPERIVGIVRVI